MRIGSSFAEPKDRRMLATWLSFDDLHRLITACLSTPVLGHSVIFGMSDNAVTWWDNSRARHIGFVELSVQSAFFSTGQRCTASSRLIVTEGIYPKFVEAMKARMATLKVGDALAAGIDIGPVSSLSQLEQDLSYVDIGQKEGAVLLAGGERLKLATDGFFMAPALLPDTTADMRINREEVFGPVASIIRVKGYEEALFEANNTPFGLAAGVATTRLKYATHFKRHSQAGMVMVNLPTAGVDYHVPFGGRKGSSYGPREQGRYTQEFYTVVKTAYTLA